MSVFKYAEGSPELNEEKRVPEVSEDTEEVREERKDSNQPAPAERGETQTYDDSPKRFQSGGIVPSHKDNS